MADVAITTVTFKSESGDCPADLEAALFELHKTIEYHAKNLARQFGLEVEIEEN
jgi:hypothetical protein